MDGTGDDFLRLVREALRITDGDKDAAWRLVVQRLRIRRNEDASAAREYGQAFETARQAGHKSLAVLH